MSDNADFSSYTPTPTKMSMLAHFYGSTMDMSMGDLTETEGTLDYDPVKITVAPEYLEIKPASPGTPISSKPSLWIRLKDIICVHVDESAYMPTQQLYCLEHADEEAKDLKSDLSGLKFHQYDMTGLPEAFVDDFKVGKLPRHLAIGRKGAKETGVVYVVVSSGSGAGQAERLYENALKPMLEGLGLRAFEVVKTESEESVAEFARETLVKRAEKDLEQTVVLLAGDGGIVDLVNEVMKEGLGSQAKLPTLALLPMGTANALAHSAGLVADHTLGLRSLVRGSARSLPTFKVNVSKGSNFVVDHGQGRLAMEKSSGQKSEDGSAEVYGAVVFSWGLHASLVAASDTVEYRKHGIDRFKMAAEELLGPKDGSESHRYKGKVSLHKKGKTEFEPMDRKEHMYVLATMVSNLEELFCISPDSKPLDSQMRLVSFGVVDPKEVMRILGAAYQGGQHVKEGAVDYEQIDGLRIDFKEEEERWRQVCVDGKIIAVGKDGWVEVRRESREGIKLVVS